MDIKIILTMNSIFTYIKNLYFIQPKSILFPIIFKKYYYYCLFNLYIKLFNIRNDISIHYNIITIYIEYIFFIIMISSFICRCKIKIRKKGWNYINFKSILFFLHFYFTFINNWNIIFISYLNKKKKRNIKEIINYSNFWKII